MQLKRNVHIGRNAKQLFINTVGGMSLSICLPDCPAGSASVWFLFRRARSGTHLSSCLFTSVYSTRWMDGIKDRWRNSRRNSPPESGRSVIVSPASFYHLSRCLERASHKSSVTLLYITSFLHYHFQPSHQSVNAL